MRYLSGAPYAPVMRWEYGGFMFSPEKWNRTLDLEGVVWGADNGCYTAGERFSVARWLAFLQRWQGRGQCAFAVLPDVPFDHAATIARSLPHVAAVRSLGYPAALAIQNGASVGNIPWDDLDAVFIAGDRPFKTSQTAWLVCREAKRRGKHVHIARRNSKRAMQISYDMGADTIDGNHLVYAPDRNWQRMQRWYAAFCPHDRVRAWGDDARFGRCEQCGRDVWKVA